MHISHLIKTVLLIFMMALTSFAQEPLHTINLDELITEGLKNNPQLHSFFAASKAAEEKVPQAGALPDPMVSLNILNLPVESFVFDQEAMTGKQIAVKQTFPFWGKLDLMENISQKGADVSAQNFEEMRIQLIRNIKLTYYSLYYIDEAITTTTKNRDLLKEFVKIAEQKYAVGNGAQQDVLKAQVELSKMLDKLVKLQQKREVIEAQLNTLLNRPVTQPLGKTTHLTFKPIVIDRPALEQQAHNKRPLLKAWQARLKQSDERIALAKKDFYPNLSVFAAYNQRDVLQSGMGGADFLSGGISFSVPIYFWRKQSKAVEEKKQLRLQVSDRYKDTENQIYSKLDQVLTSLKKNEERLDLYQNGIVPQATQSLQSAMIGYQTDKVDFLTLVNNQLTLFNLELESEHILSEYNKDISRLEYITGGTL